MEILPWCKGINWRNKFGEFQNEKENLWKRMDYKILVRHEDLEHLIRTQTHWVWVWFYFIFIGLDNLRIALNPILKTRLSVEKESVTILVLLEIVIDHHMKWIWTPKENLDLQWNATIVMSGKKKWQKHIIQTRTGTVQYIIGSLEKKTFYFREDCNSSNRSRNILMSDSDSDSAYASNNSSLLNRSWPWILHPYCASNCHVTAFSRDNQCHVPCIYNNKVPVTLPTKNILFSQKIWQQANRIIISVLIRNLHIYSFSIGHFEKI